jgi:hypothetical protein
MSHCGQPNGSSRAKGSSMSDDKTKTAPQDADRMMVDGVEKELKGN